MQSCEATEAMLCCILAERLPEDAGECWGAFLESEGWVM
jgi:hypothetical protein